MQTVQVDGTQLAYIEQGEGDPVVLVHGTLGDYRSWQLQMEAFAETYRTISYSRRYHHPNECSGDETDYSAALHADDLAAFIKGLGFHSAHVVGTSYGAYTALLLAARHPERVRALVLGDPPVFPLITDSAEGRALRDQFLENVWQPVREKMERGRVEDGARVFVDGVVEDGTFDRFSPEVQDLILDNACELQVETSSPDFWTPFTCEEAGRVKKPTLLLTGDRSRWMLQFIVNELDRCLPNSELARIPETTHELPADNPGAYNEIVLEFLAKHSAPASGE